MSLSWSDFFARRRPDEVQFIPAPGATRTVMVCSHIWWTEQIALAFHNAGCNLVLHPPFYTLYTDEPSWGVFDKLWDAILANIHAARVDLLVGGNTSAMLFHPRTGQSILQVARAQGRPLTLVNWWWDELRTRPPLARAGVGPAEFLRHLADTNTVNAIWDLDVLEELQAQFGLTNLLHLPLATHPEFWPDGYLPLEQRPLAACFLGNCHFTADWIETDADPLFPWARAVVALKIAEPRRPMKDCIDAASAQRGGMPTVEPRADDPWHAFSRAGEVLNAAYMHYTRNRLVHAAETHLHGKLALVGKGWDKLGLRANMEHAREKSGVVYGQSQVCLNLFGGCVHGGLPLRPYDIGASGGLIVTHDQRELPAMFEPGAECLVFRGQDEMLALIDQVRADPARYNAVAQAGRRRVLTHHTWSHRVSKLLAAAPLQDSPAPAP